MSHPFEHLGPAFRNFKPGVRVSLNARHLRNTGQLKGGECHTVWVVVECNCDMCKLGRHVAVNQASVYEDLKWRHFHKEALYIKGQSDSRNSPSSHEITLKRHLEDGVGARTRTSANANTKNAGLASTDIFSLDLDLFS